MTKNEIKFVGNKTANGATIISACEINSKVLCFWQGKFVVWTYNISTRNCECGHYFERDFKSASEAFEFNRGKKYWENV